MFSFILQAARGILSTFICADYISNNFNGIFNKK